MSKLNHFLLRDHIYRTQKEALEHYRCMLERQSEAIVKIECEVRNFYKAKSLYQESSDVFRGTEVNKEFKKDGGKYV